MGTGRAIDKAGGTERLRVVIAGGGVAGVEALLALSRLAPGLVAVELLSPSERLVNRAMFVAEPFGAKAAPGLDVGRVIREAGATQLHDSLASVDPAAHTVATEGGETLAYDALLVAVGARPVDAIPGALTFGPKDERRRFGRLLASFGHAGTRRLAFVVPPGVTWSIAAYELALLTAMERDERRLSETEVVLVTHERSPLGLFGPEASELVARRLDDARIEVQTACAAERFDRGELTLRGGERVPADAAVALPSLAVPSLPGLPQTERGFVRTDVAMSVAGLSDVWAAGDVTLFPVKQGGLAAQQADVAARTIAIRAGADVPWEPFRPVLRAALITGGVPEFLRKPIGGSDEPTAAAEGRALWWPPEKIAGRYLARYPSSTVEAGELVDIGPPADPGAAQAESERVVYLVLAAAEEDAARGDYEQALKWLSLVEELNLVIPPHYVARRHEWRLHIDPDAAADPAVRRLDPSFESGGAALSDLRRRVGWLRRSQRDAEKEMTEHLAHLDAGLVELTSVVRKSGLERPDP